MIVSCSSKENKTLIYSTDTESYGVDISTIDTKINELGIAQCSKYMKTIKNDSVYHSYGLSLAKMFAYTLGTTEKYIGELPLDSMKTQYLEVAVRNFSPNSLNYDSIIHLSLSNVFRLEATPFVKKVQGYRLEIENSGLSKDFITECGASKMRFEGGKWIASSISLGGISKTIDQSIETVIDLSHENSICYAVDFIVSEDFNKMNDHLSQYGFRFKGTEFDQTYYTISSSDDN